MRVCIHRGAHEIGGNCVEVAAGGARVLLDLGWPLTASNDDDVPLPTVPGLAPGETDPPALLLSHPHPDHYGLVRKASEALPIYMGGAAARILAEADYFHGLGLTRPLAGTYRDREPFTVGPFTVTPYLVDHSAYDAYALLVETPRRRLFYSGDLRGHGRKAALFERLLADPPRDIDVLLMEGTQIDEDTCAATGGPSELDVEAACVATFRATSGLVLACYSAQNIDRLVGMYRAAVRTGRELVMDLYTASIAAATDNPNIPQPGWDGVRVFLPADQRARVIETEAFHRTASVRAARIYAGELDARASELVLTFRSAMMAELAGARCLRGARAIWSMWPGYLDEPGAERLLGFLADHHIPLVHHHTSGHAYVPDLQRLVTALAPRRVVPIHSFAPGAFARFFEGVTCATDGEWWEA